MLLIILLPLFSVMYFHLFSSFLFLILIIESITYVWFPYLPHPPAHWTLLGHPRPLSQAGDVLLFKNMFYWFRERGRVKMGQNWNFSSGSATTRQCDLWLGHLFFISEAKSWIKWSLRFSSRPSPLIMWLICSLLEANRTVLMNH